MCVSQKLTLKWTSCDFEMFVLSSMSKFRIDGWDGQRGLYAPGFRGLHSDVFGAPKPEGDVPESLIPKPDPTWPQKSEPETIPNISQS